jgi:N-ethylmaleimide reductase
MTESILFSAYDLQGTQLSNRMVMSPMTRCRAIGNIPNDLIAQYYRQRAGAGLIITEGTSPSPNGLGYARMPGIFSEAQITGWKKVTTAVHEANGKIFIQLMHCGRIGHPANMPADTRIIAPSGIKAAGKMWTDAFQMQEHPVPEEMTTQDIAQTKLEFIKAASNSIAAGFDGIELHGANGYLLEQFLSPHTNIRSDNYGGSIENRCRFVLEVAVGVAEAIGAAKTAIRLSPYGVGSDMAPYPEIFETYDYLTKELNKLQIAYVHVADHSAMGAPAVPIEMKTQIRSNFTNTIILAGGYTRERAEADINSKLCDLVAFGRPFINNPDLPYRLQHNLALSTDFKAALLYAADEKGYTDYPTINS